MFGEHNPISDNKFSWGCWSVNFPKSNKEQGRAASISLHSDNSRDKLPCGGEIPHSECAIVKRTLFSNVTTQKSILSSNSRQERQSAYFPKSLTVP